MSSVRKFRDRKEYVCAVLEYFASQGKEQESLINVTFEGNSDAGAGYRYEFAATFVSSEKLLLRYSDYQNPDDPLTLNEQAEALSSQVDRLRNIFQGLEARTVFVFDSKAHRIYFTAPSSV